MDDTESNNRSQINRNSKMEGASQDGDYDGK